MGFNSFVAKALNAVNPDSVSKVVDANGEPMVVYHGREVQTMKTFPDPLTKMLPPSPKLLAQSAMQSRGVPSDIQEKPQPKPLSENQKASEAGR